MDTLLYFISTTVRIILSFLQIMMIVRAIFSFLPVGEGNIIEEFTYMTTEPVINPIRRLFEKFGFEDGLPIDIPFFVTFMIISIVSAFL